MNNTKETNNLQSNFSDEIKEIYIDVDKDIIANLSDKLKKDNFFFSDTEKLRNDLKLKNRKKLENFNLFKSNNNYNNTDENSFYSGNTFNIDSLQAYDNNIATITFVNNIDDIRTSCITGILQLQLDKLENSNANISIPFTAGSSDIPDHYALLNMRNIEGEIYISIIDSMDRDTSLDCDQNMQDYNNNYINDILNIIKQSIISQFGIKIPKIHCSFIKGDTIELQHVNSGTEDFQNACPILTMRNYLLMNNLNNDQYLKLYNRRFEEQKKLIDDKIKKIEQHTKTNPIFKEKKEENNKIFKVLFNNNNINNIKQEYIDNLFKILNNIYKEKKFKM